MNVNSGVVIVILVVGLVTTYAVASEELKESDLPSVFGREKCLEFKEAHDAATCIAMVAFRRIEDLSIKENIEIMPGVFLSSDIPESERELYRKRTKILPKTGEDRFHIIIDMMYNVMNNLFAARTLKVKMNEETSNSVMRAFEEGRGKIKKIAGPLMLAIGAKLLAIVPILLGGLALFASKALLVSKLALIIALIVGAQSLFSGGGNFLNRFGGGGGGGGWGNYGGSYGGGYSGGHNYIGAYGAPASGWNTASSQSYPYARSLNDAQDLAYSSQKP